VAYSLSTPEQPSSASLRFSVKVYRDAPSATRSNLLKPPEPSANMLAASPTSPFASELSSPRVSLPAPVPGVAAAAAQLLAEGGDGAVALMRYSRSALSRRRMSDSRQVLQVRVPNLDVGGSSRSSPGQRRAANGARQVSQGQPNGRSLPKDVPGAKAHSTSQARRPSPRYRRGSAAAAVGHAAGVGRNGGLGNPYHGTRRLSASPRERKRNAATAAGASASPPTSSSAGGALMSARLSPDAEYYRISTDHPPGSVPSRCRKVDASTLTETSPIRRLAEGLSSSTLGQRSFSGPELILSDEQTPAERRRQQEGEDDDAALSRGVDGTLSIAVPALPRDRPPPPPTERSEEQQRSSRSSQSSLGSGWHRRPRSLLQHQQPEDELGEDATNTAPLATPEQDSSLLDAISVDGPGVAQQLEEDEAMEDEVFEDASSNTSSANSRRGSAREEDVAGFPSGNGGEGITFVFESPSDSSAVDTAPNSSRANQSSSTAEEMNSNHGDDMEVVNDVFDNNNDEAAEEAMDTSLAEAALNLGARRKVRSPHTTGLAPPSEDSEGLTPSPMSVSEEGQATATFEIGDGEKDDQSSAPPSGSTTPDGRRSRSRDRRLGGADRLQLPNVDPIDPTILGAVGFSVEITPPPDSANFTHELPDVVPRREQQQHIRRRRSHQRLSAIAVDGGPIHVVRRQRAASDGGPRRDSLSAEEGGLVAGSSASSMLDADGALERRASSHGDSTAARAVGRGGHAGEVPGLPAIPTSQQGSFRVTLAADEMLPPCEIMSYWEIVSFLTHLSFPFSLGGQNGQPRPRVLHRPQEPHYHLAEASPFNPAGGGTCCELEGSLRQTARRGYGRRR